VRLIIGKKYLKNDEYLAPQSDSIWGSVMSSDFYHK